MLLQVTYKCKLDQNEQPPLNNSVNDIQFEMKLNEQSWSMTVVINDIQFFWQSTVFTTDRKAWKLPP